MRFPSLKSAAFVVVAALAAASLPGAVARADASSSPSSPVVARVGSRVITAAELERRLAEVPLYQLRAFGRTASEVRRGFLERVMVREILFAEGAAERKMAERPEVQDRLRGVLRAALLGRVREETATGSPVTDAEVRAYYEQNRAKYRAPARVAIWRIVVASREEAQSILDDIKKDPNVKRWSDLAREKSLDKSNSMRSGNLGFVTPDGTTGEPDVKVSPEIIAAANAVKDGELVPDPVKEGDRFSVVWRRQSMREVERTLEQEALSISQILAHQKLETNLKSLLDKLHREEVALFSPELVDQIEITATGDLQQLRRPGVLPSSKRVGPASPAPAQRPGGLR